MIPEQKQFKFYYTSPNDNLCNQTSSPSQHVIAAEGVFFWCNGPLSKTLSKNINKELWCLPETLVPQLTLLTPSKYLSWNSPPDIRIKQAVFLPVVASASLVTSGCLFGRRNFNPLVVEASIESLASLQRQLTSLTQVALEN